MEYRQLSIDSNHFSGANREMTAITKIDSSRQREIAQVLLQHGWDYMRQILTIGKVKRVAGDGIDRRSTIE
jgi:hypothetical protein